MGIISQGILGAISGKVGNVIGASWRGIPYLRIKPASVSNPRTVAQVAQRNKFALTQTFVRAMRSFIDIGYKFQQNRMTAVNAASSYILRNAITGADPFEVDYANALVSRGSLPGVVGLEAIWTGNSLNLNWTNNAGTGQAVGEDVLLVAAYSPANAEASVLTDGGERGTESAALTLPAHFAGNPVQVFAAFQSADGRAVSDSVHLGPVTQA